jgi:hypothetical protein
MTSQADTGLVTPGDPRFKPPEDLEDFGDVEAFTPVRSGTIWSRLAFEPTYDPLDMIRTAFHVKTKTARVIPFNLFETQERYVAGLNLKNIVVKPRQVGLSTINLALMTAVSATTPNINSLVITHRDDMTESFRQTIKDFIERLNLHHGMGIRIGKDNADMLHLPDTDSWFFFGSGTAPGVGRSRTIHMLLASELAHWQGENPGAELTGMTESMPDNGLIMVESTPNGAVGPFYGIYTDTQNGYQKHFFPWFIEKSRRIPLNGKKLHLTPEERMLETQHGLDHEQIAWRRVKWAQMESQKLYFPQEYPEDDVGCFVAGLKSSFPAAKMAEFMTYARSRNYAEYEVPGDPWDPGGQFKVWEGPQTETLYVVACDVGGGHKDGDWSVAIIRKARTGEHVATLEGHWTPASFARETVKIARMYNMALLSHESNGLGEGAVTEAAYRLNYSNYYWQIRGGTYDPNSAKTVKAEDMKPGFNVSPAIRSHMTSGLVDEVATGLFRSPDETLIRQMSAARQEHKKVGGRWVDVLDLPQHVHDDHFMAYAQSSLLLHEPVSEQARNPVPGM